MSRAAPGWFDGPEKIARLRALWDEGVPTDEMAILMGTTKGAVIGKVQRLGFPPRRRGLVLWTGALGPRSARAPKSTRKPNAGNPATSEVAGPDGQQVGLGRIGAAALPAGLGLEIAARRIAEAPRDTSVGREAAETPAAAGHAVAADTVPPRIAAGERPFPGRPDGPHPAAPAALPLERPLTPAVSPGRGSSAGTCLWCEGDRGAVVFCEAPRVPGSRWCAEHAHGAANPRAWKAENEARA